MFKRALSATLVVCSLVAMPAMGGTVYLQDGSVLNGEVRLVRDGKLTLITDYAGELVLNQAAISSVATDQPMILRLENGKDQQAQLLVNDEGQQRISSNDSALNSIAVNQIADLRPLGSPGPESLVAEADTDGPWSGSLQVGVSGSSGNSDNQNIDVRASTTRETENNRLKFEALLHKASQDDQQTEDEIRALARLEQDYSERAFVFGQFEVERDQFEEVDVRYRATVGPGYFILQKPDHELKTRAGLGFEQERFEGGNVENNFVLTLGYDYRIDLWEWFRLTHNFTAIPDIGDEPSKNYRLESALGGELPLGSKDSLWRLRGEYRHEYDNNPEPGVEDLDTNYLLSIVRDFE